MKDKKTNNTEARAIFLGALLAFVSVALGAFGAHGLEAHLAVLGHGHTYATASEYLFYHALALLLIGNLMHHRPQAKRLNLILLLIFFGSIIFSGSLFLLAVTDIKWLGAITPIGGILLLIAWAMLAFTSWQQVRDRC